MTGPMLIMTATTTAADKVALGVLNSHVVEDTEVIIGVVGLLAAVTLRHDLAGVNVIEQALVGVRDWTLLNGPHPRRSGAGRGPGTRATTFHSPTSGRPGVPSTDRSITMSTSNASTSSRGPGVRSALGFIAIITFLVAGLAACSSPGDTYDEWQPHPVSEIEPDENENEPDEYENEPPENENEADENEANEGEADENEADEGEAHENEGDENEGNEGEEDENEADESEEGEGEGGED